MQKTAIETMFGGKEKLRLHQLRLLEWHANKQHEGKQKYAADDTENGAEKSNSGIPQKWILTRGITLHEWQEQCIQKWHESGQKGTIKVVTGGGKTVLGLALAERLQNNTATDLRVAIVVPTIVLMHQWYDELRNKGNLPPGLVGRLGGGYKDSLDENCRILICVLKSASTKLPKMAKKDDISKKLLLIVDECHRASATKTSKVLSTERAYSLGLSATPEHDEEANANYDDSTVGRALGGVIYELSYVDAFEYGLIPPFTIRHMGVELSQQERAEYDQLTRRIRDAHRELQGLSTDSSFDKWARRVAKSQSPHAPLASRYVSDVNKRKELLFRAKSRTDVVVELIKNEISANADARVILFHERVSEAERLFFALMSAGFKAIVEHSDLPDGMRSDGLKLFRDGQAKILVSVKSLIEGFNVPEADVGIIAASSSSPRQRIQSMGRVMRQHLGKDGEERTACIYVVYVRDTADENIYRKFDWEKLTGAERNSYYEWTKSTGQIEQSSPPKAFVPGENEIDASALEVGKPYPGAYEGIEYSCDNNYNVATVGAPPKGGSKYIPDAKELAEMVIDAKGPGRFKITPKKNFVLVYSNKQALYAGAWEIPESPAARQETIKLMHQHDCSLWAQTAKPGDEYPVQNPDLANDKWRYKQGQGGQIVEQIHRGIRRASVGADARDAAKGEDAEKLLAAIRELAKSGESITNLVSTQERHILFRKEGKLRFIAVLSKGLEFPN